ncbi:MAG: hypothetical protein WD066_09665 [Planctomycetaceae bacterium]
MNARRVFWSLIAAIVLLVVAGGVAIYAPYQREKAALEEFERLEVRVDRPAEISVAFRVLAFLPDRFGWITIDAGGPKWLRNIIGYERTRPFDRVSTVLLHGRAHGWFPDLPEIGNPSTLPIGEHIGLAFPGDKSGDPPIPVDSVYPPMPDELRQRLVPLLLELRSIDELTIDEGLLSDEELLALHRRFPAARITFRQALNVTREWTPPPR